MRKFIYVSLIVSNSLFAMNYDNAITTFKKSCKSCHGTPYYGAQMLDEDQWEEFFEKGDDKLLSVHQKDKKALKKITASYYKNRREDLIEFLVNNAKDSGAVPPCTSNTCGIHR